MLFLMGMFLVSLCTSALSCKGSIEVSINDVYGACIAGWLAMLLLCVWWRRRRGRSGPQSVKTGWCALGPGEEEHK